MQLETDDGVTLYYEVAGSGDRLILTHGSWGDGRSWAGVVDRLARDHAVVTWDRRGHSRSSDGPGRGTFQRDADDLAELAAHLGGAAHLIGASSGASIVLKTAASHPELVRSACVHEPDMLGIVDDSRFAAQLERERAENLHVIGLVESGHEKEAARYFIDEIAVGPGAWDALPRQARDGFVSNAATVVDELDDVFDRDPVEVGSLEQLGKRLMITRGTDSPELLIAVAEELERRLPDAVHVTLRGAGHIPYRTHPELWCGTVLGFVDAVD